MPYKITDAYSQTYGGCQWGIGVTHGAKGKGKNFCGDGIIHYYEDPYLAVFANPIHGNYDPATMQIWEFKPVAKVAGDQLKSGCKTGTTIRQVPASALTTEQRVEIAIRCAFTVCHTPAWVEWAGRWLSGADRTEAAWAVWEPAWAPRDAAWPALAAALAAAADVVARYAAGVDARYAAQDAAQYAARYAALAAARAAADAENKLDLIAIIRRVVGK